MWTKEQQAVLDKKTTEALRSYGVTATMSDEEFKDPKRRAKKLLKMHRQMERGNADAFLLKVGQHIREKRQAAGIGQEAVAATAMMGTADVSLIENGRRNASITTLKNLAEAMGCELRIEFVRKYGKG